VIPGGNLLINHICINLVINIEHSISEWSCLDHHWDWSTS